MLLFVLISIVVTIVLNTIITHMFDIVAIV